MKQNKTLSRLALAVTCAAVGGILAGQLRTGAAESRPRASLIVAPVGSVIAYMGSNDNLPENWLPCDGRPLQQKDYPELYATLAAATGLARTDSAFHLPDLRGEFLRGANAGRADAAADATANRALGSAQEYATALPRQNFMTAKDGAHTHAASGTVNTFWWNGPHSDREANHGDDFLGAVNRSVDVTVKSDQSAHQHVINQGGDKETRPNNVAVNWIIRAR